MPLFLLFLLVPLFSRFSPFPCSFCLHFFLCCPVFLVPPVPLFTLFPCSPCSPVHLVPLVSFFPCSPCSPLSPCSLLLACSPCAPCFSFYLVPLLPLFPFLALTPCFTFFLVPPVRLILSPPRFPFSFCFPLSPDSPCSPVLYVFPFPCSTVPCSSVSLSKSKGYTISVHLSQTRYWTSMLWSVDSFQKRGIRRAPQDCIEVRCTAH